MSVCGGCPLPECDPHCPGSGATITLPQSDYDHLAAAERDRDELRTQLAEACGKKDEVIHWYIVTLCGNCTKCSAENIDPHCINRGLRAQAEHALSSTPASVKQHAEEARIGRAVEEWAKEMHDLAQDGGPIPSGRLLLQVLDKVIAQAKEEEHV